MKVEDVFGNLPTLETDRLVLRRLTRGDAGDIFEYGSDPEVSRYTTWEAHRSLDDTLDFLTSVLDRYAKGQVAPWGLMHKRSGKVIGTCGFLSWLPNHARAEIAYAISREYWNQGLTTEAARVAVAFGFRTMHLNRIEARCEIPNVASARLMEKLGMVFEGTLRQYWYQKGRYVDLKLYSILKHEWVEMTNLVVSPG